jgi:hypothetical protein
MPDGFEQEPLRIYDATGLEVKRLKGGTKGKHAVGDLPPGVYFLQVEGLKTSRMVIIP